MKNAQLLFLSFLIYSIGSSQSSSPFVVAASGEHHTADQVQLTWTLGESIIATFSSGVSQLSQGFHQTDLVVTPVRDLAGNLDFKVYPNPTTAEVNIEWSKSPGPLRLSLYDASGKKLWMLPTSVDSDIVTLDLSAYSPGNYFLQLSNQARQTINSINILKFH